jgi:spore germination cell wall hydrolase CwlJ-like protein
VSVSKSVKRSRPEGARLAPFGLAFFAFAVVFTLAPTEVGYQDIASLLARQPGVAERWQQRMFASATATIQVATFSFSTPLGTSTPEAPAYQLASLDSRGDITGSLTRNPLTQAPRRYQPSEFPTVDRTLKGDRLAKFTPEPVPADGNPKDSFPSNASVMGQKTTDAAPAEPAPLDPELAEALKAPPLPQYDASKAPPEVDPLSDSRAVPDTAVIAVEPAAPRDGFSVKTASLYFGSSSLGAPLENIERWQPGEEPLIVSPGAPDPDMKATASLPAVAADPSSAGESIASKGEVNGDDQKSRTPAQRLGLLDEKVRAKQERCLTDAVYFEARGEAVRGQIAVAQVVMNRVFSGFYPTTVCGVVYQNSHRHLACQFTFACDGIRDVVNEPDMWDRAKKIAKATLDGRLWLPEVGKSTHYHAYWVHPSWVHEMKKMYRTGVHTFYRPRAWGDGSDAPSWGTPAQTAAISKQLAELKP